MAKVQIKYGKSTYLIVFFLQLIEKCRICYFVLGYNCMIADILNDGTPSS